MEVKVEEHLVEMDCQISVKQEIENVEVKFDLSTHQIGHMINKLHQCKHCGKTFKNLFFLKSTKCAIQRKGCINVVNVRRLLHIKVILLDTN